MFHQTQKYAYTRPGQIQPDPLQQMHQHLQWALGVATVALIINAIVVVTLY